MTMNVPVGAGEVLSTVGFLGRIVTFVGAGEVRCGEGTLASPMMAGMKRRGNRSRATQGSPPLIPATPAPTRRTRFPARFITYLPVKAGEVWTWGGDACVAHGLCGLPSNTVAFVANGRKDTPL